MARRAYPPSFPRGGGGQRPGRSRTGRGRPGHVRNLGDPFPEPRAASGFDRNRTWFKKGPGPSVVTRPAPIPADYQVWKQLALLLYSGRSPEGLEVEGPLSLAKLRIRSLPARLSVRGDLDLRQCQRLNRIGDGLLVGGDLLVGGKFTGSRRWDSYLIEEPWPSVLHTLSKDGQCPLPELPAGLLVGRDLKLRQCRHLKRLPGRPPGRALDPPGKLHGAGVPARAIRRSWRPHDLGRPEAGVLAGRAAGRGEPPADRRPVRAVAGRPPGQRRPHPRVLSLSRRAAGGPAGRRQPARPTLPDRPIALGPAGRPGPEAPSPSRSRRPARWARRTRST